MSRIDRYCPRPLSAQAGEPFGSAEEAWLWYAACQLARLDGARSVAGAAAVARPCDPDDVYRVVDRLYKARHLLPDHLAVLGSYGRRLAPPDPYAGDPPAAARLWSEALDLLAADLRHKGIVS